MMDAIKRVISGDDFQESEPHCPNGSESGEDRMVGMDIDKEGVNHPNDIDIDGTDTDHDHETETDAQPQQQQQQQQQPALPKPQDHVHDREHPHTYRPSLEGERPLANLVENEGDTIAADKTDDYHLNVALSETPRSSLSDMSAEGRLRDYHAEVDPEGTHTIPTRSLSRMPPRLQPSLHDWESIRLAGNATPDRNWDESSSIGKTGNSQTSSRDWGWFEDVHASSDRVWVGGKETLDDGRKAIKDSTTTSMHMNNDNYNSNHKNKNNKRKTTSSGATRSLLPSQESIVLLRETLEPLVQRDLESDAAAMAVTAPNYVLEESLSSQRLWKYTAGQRPPQPMEERAFFEKMWAQNFARSQVEYQMPVEVLTATTPISLNPFADSNFVAQANELSQYNLEDATEKSHHHPQTKKQHPSDMAEAALMRKLNEPARIQLTEDAHHLTHDSQPQHPKHQPQQQVVKNDGGDTLTVLVKGDNVFGTTVSKSFARPSEYGGPIKGVDTVNISVASYRVVESKKHGKYAQFLVIYREGSIRDTLGVWKRYSDFQELSRKVTQAHEGCSAVMANISPLAIAEEHEVEHLPNAITSWRLLKKRQRWYRCLDAGYLSLKVFLLERFLHDILFESSSPDLLRDFVGVAQPTR